MSQQQLESVIADVKDVFGKWGPQTTLTDMRRDWDELFGKLKPKVAAKSQAIKLGGVSTRKVVAEGVGPGRSVLYFHGGGYVFGSPHSHHDLACHLSKAAQAEVYVLDYRLAPEYPYPSAIEDAVAAYKALLEQGVAPQRLALAGDSAGGGLTFATLLSLRTAGIGLPACAVTFSPWTDMEATGESMTTKAAVDPMVSRDMATNLAPLYLPGGNLKNPLASPIHADLTGLPPVMVQVGERECLLDDSVRIVERARRASVPVEFEIWPGQIHVWQIFASRLDEGAEALEKSGAFIRGHIP